MKDLNKFEVAKLRHQRVQEAIDHARAAELAARSYWASPQYRSIQKMDEVDAAAAIQNPIKFADDEEPVQDAVERLGGRDNPGHMRGTTARGIYGAAVASPVHVSMDDYQYMAENSPTGEPPNLYDIFLRTPDANEKLEGTGKYYTEKQTHTARHENRHLGFRKLEYANHDPIPAILKRIRSDSGREEFMMRAYDYITADSEEEKKRAFDFAEEIAAQHGRKPDTKKMMDAAIEHMSELNMQADVTKDVLNDLNINKGLLQERRNAKKKLQPLIDHSKLNRRTGKARKNEDGSMSTVLSGSVSHPKLNNGRPTLIPFLYDGREVSEEVAIQRAIKSGEKWPSFATHEEATAASKQLSKGL